MNNIWNRIFMRMFGKIVRQVAFEETQKSDVKIQAWVHRLIDEKGYDTRLLQVEDNLRNNNSYINAQIKGSSCDDIDYFDFENYFRGSREVIKEWQKGYLKYLKKYPPYRAVRVI